MLKIPGEACFTASPPGLNKKVEKGKATIFYFSNKTVIITDKLEVDGALLLPPSLHQCSFLRVFKASQSYTERREAETGDRTRDLAH